MLSDPDLCVCALLYSADEYSVKLASRLLNAEFVQLGLRADVRLGLNGVGDKTREIVSGVVNEYLPHTVLIDAVQNIGKYPMMRQLFAARQITAPLTMWFDDDSCIVPGTDISSWLERIKKQLTAFAMLGSVYQQRFVGNQLAWIRAQPWYRGLAPQPYAKFVTGGWWVIRTPVLQELQWPPDNLTHRGGDVMLGEALRQRGLRVGHFRDGLWINANEHGVEAKSPRRSPAEAAVGVDYAEDELAIALAMNTVMTGLLNEN